MADATGRFRVERIAGVWWFVDPDGHGFFSSGVNSANIAADFSFARGRVALPRQRPAGARLGLRLGQWPPRKRLRRWGVNTIGAFSLPHLFAAGCRTRCC